MPKRSNDFQKIVTTIYKQIVPDGGTVTESGMVRDKDAGVLREVDILVEYTYAGHNFKFIVECRDRSRAATVEWIDGLIGKAKSLGVNKVVAVASKGFTAAAKKKALDNDIEVLTFEDAEETDWAKFPIKPGVVVLTADTYQIQQVLFEVAGEYVAVTTLWLGREAVVNGESVGDVKGLIEYFFQEHLVPGIERYTKEHFFEIFKTKEDIGRTKVVESEHVWNGLFVMDESNNKIEVSKVKFIVVGNRRTADVLQKHQKFKEKMVSMGKHLDGDRGAIHFVTVQDPDTRKLQVSWYKNG